MMHKTLPPLFLAFFGTLTLWAEVRITARVQPQSLPPESTLKLTLKVEYKGSPSLSSPRLPPLPDFQLTGQSSSHSYEFQAGISQSQKEFHYFLRPTKEGEFEIGPLRIEVNGKEYASEPVKVQVSSRIPAPAPPDPAGPGRGFKGFGRMFEPFFGGDPWFSPGPTTTLKKQDLFLKLHTHRKQPYVGEMILARWWVYLLAEKAGRSLSSQITQSPALNDFWVENINPPGKILFASPTGDPEEIKGKQYLKDELHSLVLLPLRAGILKIGKLSAHLKPRFFLTSPLFQKTSPSQSVTVQPLPQKNQPSHFTGAVGDFQLSAEISKTKAHLKEPLLYTLTFKGQGHPRLIQLPSLSFGPDWEVYDITHSEQFDRKESHKKYEIILLPLKADKQKIPPLHLSTFDPELGIYKTHILPALDVFVTEGKARDRNQNPSGSPGKGPLSVSPAPTPSAKKPSIKKPSADSSPPPAPEATGQALSLRGKDQNNNKVLRWVFQNRGWLWMQIFAGGGVLFLILLALRGRGGKKDPPLRHLVSERLHRVDQKIKKKQFQEASSLLCQIIYMCLSELSHPSLKTPPAEAEEDAMPSGLRPSSQNLNALIAALNPSLKQKYEKPLRHLVSSLEYLSFAPEKQSAALRTRTQLKTLRQETARLLKKLIS